MMFLGGNEMDEWVSEGIFLAGEVGSSEDCWWERVWEREGIGVKFVGGLYFGSGEGGGVSVKFVGGREKGEK